MLLQDSVTRQTCDHCGTPYRPRVSTDRYCCHGCAYVAQMLEDGGYLRFYEIKGKATLPPVGSKVFRQAKLEWIEAAQVEAEQAQDGNAIIHASFQIEGISCIGCVWLIEAIFKECEGKVAIEINGSQNQLTLAWKPEAFSLLDFASKLQRLGYSLSITSTQTGKRRQTTELAARIGLAGFFLLNTMLFTLPSYLGMKEGFFLAPIFQLLVALFASLSFFVCGSYFMRRAVPAIRQQVLHIDLPISIGLVAAYAGSLFGWISGYTQLIYFDFVATFVFLMLLGRWVQAYAIERNHSHLQREFKGPESVTLLGGPDDGASIPATAVEAGHSYSIAPGAINPVASVILQKEALLSLEWITGEPDPSQWDMGQVAPAGAINVSNQTLRFQANESWQDSLLAELLKPTKEAAPDPKLQNILKYYIFSVLAIALTGAAAWQLWLGDSLKALQVCISVLVVSCPCALGITLPFCDQIAISRLRKVGLFIKNPKIWSQLQRIRAVVFDKTGTLTMDLPRLKNSKTVKAMDPLSKRALYQLVARNNHPIARSLCQSLLASSASLSELRTDPSQVHETIGQGVAWLDECANEWTLGKPSWRATDSPTDIQEANVVLRQNGLLIESFYFTEDIRDDAHQTIEYFRNQNMDTVILSGDKTERVQAIAESLQIPHSAVRAECKPHDKADWIHQNAPDGALMIGDGANDSIAFQQAICRGTPVVDRSILEASADFFFFGRSLRSLPKLFQVAAMRRRNIRSVFIASVLYNGLAVCICLSGYMHPLLAAILMPLSSVAILSLACLGYKERADESHKSTII